MVPLFFSLELATPSPPCSHRSSPFRACGQSSCIFFGFHHWSSLRLLLEKMCHFGCVAATKFLEPPSGTCTEIYRLSSPQQLLVSILHIHIIGLVVTRSWTVNFLYSDQYSVCSRSSSSWKMLLALSLDVSWYLPFSSLLHSVSVPLSLHYLPINWPCSVCVHILMKLTL